MTRTKDAPPDTNSRYRGGGWSSREPSWLSAASRDTYGPAYRSNRIGFRTSLAGRVKR
jgi:hypothetical protein